MKIILNTLITIDDILVGFWVIYLIIFIIKALVTKTQLDRMKRNMIIIKWAVHLFFEYFCLPVFLMAHFVSPQMETIMMIGLVCVAIGINLFYSGTPLIYFEKQVAYPWPFRFNNNKTGTGKKNLN